MSRLQNISLWALGCALMVVLLAFSGESCESIQVKGLQIEVDFNSKHYFINELEIEQTVRQEYPYLDSLFCKEINIKLLEERLDNHPSIRKAEVYSAMDGILRIRIKQKKPVYRVQNSNRGYYIDEVGDSMALSPQFSAAVPLVTGKISPKEESELFSFFGQISEHPYFDGFFTGVQVEEDGAWILYPKPGRHEILLGQPNQLEDKIARLQKFYEKVVDTTNLDSIASLNLAFDGQVVCTKY